MEKRKTDLFIAERGGWELVKEYHEGGPIFDGDKETVKAQDAKLKAAIARMQARGQLPQVPKATAAAAVDLDPFSSAAVPCGMCSKSTHKTANCPQQRWRKKTPKKQAWQKKGQGKGKGCRY